MHLVRRYLKVSVLSYVVVAFAVSSASAQGVEVKSEASEEHCGGVTFTAPHTTTGGCVIAISNSSTHVTLFRHAGTGEVASDACDSTYRLNIDESGEGYINQFRASNSGLTESPACGFTVSACDVEGNGNHEPWPVHMEEVGANSVHAFVRVCLDIVLSFGPPRLSCEIEGNIELTLTRNGIGHVESAESEGPAAQGAPLTNRVVVTHGAPHATCEGVGMQTEIAGHLDLVPNLIVEHL